MTKLSLTVPVVGEKNSAADPKIPTALKEIETVINGGLEGTNNFKAEGIIEGNLAKALQEKIGAKVSGLTFETKNESLEGTSGVLYYMEKEGSTLTLPAATKDRTIGVICASAINSVKVTASAGQIVGDFITGQATITLTKNQHVVVHASGSGWLIESGEPKREQKYGVKSELETGNSFNGEPSATRPAIAILTVVLISKTSAKVKVGGNEVGEVSNTGAETAASMITVVCPPGQKWEVSASSINTKLGFSYLTL